MQTDAHNSDLTYLKDVFKARLAGQATTLVVSDCRVDWNLPGVRPLGPDIAVFADVELHRDWATLDVAADRAADRLLPRSRRAVQCSCSGSFTTCPELADR